MPDSEILKRMDRSLDRIGSHIEHGNELMGEVRGEMRMTREVHDALVGFIREQTLRMERAANQQAKESAKVQRGLDRVVERLDDVGDQIRANTEAVLQALDRLSPGPESAG